MGTGGGEPADCAPVCHPYRLTYLPDGDGHRVAPTQSGDHHPDYRMASAIVDVGRRDSHRGDRLVLVRLGARMSRLGFHPDLPSLLSRASTR